MQEKIQKAQEFFLLAATLLLLTVPFLYPSYRSHGAPVIYFTLAAFAGFIFVMGNKFFRETEKPETPIDGYLFLIFIWTLVSAFFSTDKAASLNAAAGFFILILFYYICHSVAKKHHLAALYAVTLSAALLSLYGLYQYFIGFDASIAWVKSQAAFQNSEPFLERLGSKRVFSTLIYPNTFAGLLIMAIPVCIALIKNEKKMRPVLLAVMALLCVNLFLTKSVAGIASLAAASLFTALLIRDRELAGFRTGVFSAGIAAAAILAFVIILRGPEKLLVSLPGRIESWFLMGDVILNKFITGSGPGTFETAYNSPAFKGAQYLKYAHNAPLQAAVELGLTGAALFTAAVIFAYRTIAQNFYYTRSPQKKILVISLVTSLTAFLIHNLADFDFYVPELAFAFCAILAVLMSQMTIGTIQLKKIKLTYLLGANPGKRRRIIFAIVAAILVLSAVTGGKQSYVLSAITTLVCAGFALWSVSKEHIRVTGIEAPLAALFSLMAVSLIVTPQIHSGLSYFSLYACAAAVFFLCSQFLRRYIFKIVLADIIIYSGALLAIAAIGRYFYLAYRDLPAYADGFFPNPSLFAAFICIPFTMLLLRVLLDKKNRFLPLNASLLGIFAVSVSLAYSKSGMLTMIACFAASWFYYSLNVKRVKDSPSMASFKSIFMKISAALLVVLAFTGITPSGSKIINVQSDPFYFNRLGIYKSALLIAKESPVVGTGIGGFERGFQRHNFPIDAVARYQKTTPFAHNEYLQALSTLGIPGLAVLLWLLVAVFRRIPEYDPNRLSWAASAGAYFALAGIALHSMFYFTLHLPGIIMACAVLASMALKEEYSIATVTNEELLFKRIYFFPALLFAAVIFTAAVRPAAFNYYLNKYQSGGMPSHLNSAVSAEPLNPAAHFAIGEYYNRRKNFSAALSSYTLSLEYDRQNAMTLLKAARASAALGMKDRAYGYYLAASKADPFRAFTFSEAGNFAMFGLNDPSAAAAWYRQALEIEPNYNEARNNLALLYRQDGQYAEAIMELLTLESILLSAVPLNEYDEEIIKFPEDALYMNMASLREDTGDYGLACSLYTKAYETTPKESIKLKIKELCKKHDLLECCEQP